MYLTFTEYSTYGGTITDEATFSQYEFKARKILDGITADRIATNMAVISEAVKRCMFELIKYEQLYDNIVNGFVSGDAGGKGGLLLSSFTNDGYSEAYAMGESNTGDYLDAMRKALTDAERRTAHDYLAYEFDDSHIPLLYRGVYNYNALV